jgi:hypothetical protein
VLGSGLFLGCIIAVVSSADPRVTVNEVVEEIHGIALRRAERPGVEDGGLIGPWWVTASGVDPQTGRLLAFRIRSGDLRVAARSASLIVDADADTFTFELNDVVMTRFPDSGAANGSGGLLALEHHVLGPIAYGTEIEPDAIPSRQLTAAD